MVGAPRSVLRAPRSALRAATAGAGAGAGTGGGALDTPQRRVDHDSLRRPRIPAMSSTLTIDGPCRRTLAFSIERAAVDAVIEERVAALAQRSRFKGFRPGHAPAALIRKTYGKEAAEDARRQL